MYIARHLEHSIRTAAKMFSAVIVTGARQVGKTTLLMKVNGEIPYLTLDDPLLLQSAMEEPGTFFKINPPPLILDEIQYAPELFPYIKMIADKDRKKGQFYMSGSQQFQLMKNVSESLAGRIGILNLMGLSQREINCVDFTLPFVPTVEYLTDRKASVQSLSYKEVWRTIHRGSMPEMQREEMDWQLFYSAYVKTYIERDVRQLTNIGDEVKFIKFITSLAANSGNLLNYASLSRDTGISEPTAERWISILVASNIIYLLQPYHNNVIKRAVKTPKVYFLDTGLAAYLTKWNTPEVLESGAAAGAFFETFVIAEIIKSYANAGKEPPLYFYRDKEQNEIDLLIFENGTLYPIEIKKNADPRKEHIKAFRMIEGIHGVERGQGGIICLYENVMALAPNDFVIPLCFI